MKWSLRIFGHEITLLGYYRPPKMVYVAGITNRCRNGEYIIFLDYDNIPVDWVIDELKFLQERYNLGDFILLRSSKNGFHAINPTKVSLNQLVTILRASSTDAAFKNVPLLRARKVWTLRTTMKKGSIPKYYLTLRHSTRREGSRPHWRVLQKLYNLPSPRNPVDTETRFWTGHYHIAGGGE